MKQWPLWREWEKEYKDIIRRHSNNPYIEMSQELRQLANKMQINISGANIQGTINKEIIYIDDCIKKAIHEAKRSFLVLVSICVPVIISIGIFILNRLF